MNKIEKLITRPFSPSTPNAAALAPSKAAKAASSALKNQVGDLSEKKDYCIKMLNLSKKHLVLAALIVAVLATGLLNTLPLLSVFIPFLAAAASINLCISCCALSSFSREMKSLMPQA